PSSQEEPGGPQSGGSSGTGGESGTGSAVATRTPQVPVVPGAGGSPTATSSPGAHSPSPPPPSGTVVTRLPSTGSGSQDHNSILPLAAIVAAMAGVALSSVLIASRKKQ